MFWVEFHDHNKGCRMSFTAINDVLRKRRVEYNKRIAQEEQEKLGSGFSSQYQVRGKPMVRASAIAKRVQKNQQ